MTNRWRVDDRFDLLLEGVREAHVHIVGGEVGIKAGDCPSFVEVERVDGDAPIVEFADGVLEVRYDQPRRGLAWTGDRAVVGLTVPPATDVVVVTASAGVAAAGLVGEGSVRTASGDVVLDRIGGRVQARTASGEIDAREPSGALRCETVSGELTVARGSAPSISARSVSGSIVMDVAVQPGGEYELSTVSGDVALRLGDDPGARVDIRSVSGRIDSAFDDDDGEHAGARRAGSGRWSHGMRHVVREIGDARADVVVRTVSGNVALVRPLAVAL